MSLLGSTFCHPLRMLYYHLILRINSISSDCSLHSGSDLSVSSLHVMHRVIRKLWMDRPTFRQPAGEQCSLNTPLCPQSTGKQYQRGGLTWGRGFHIAPCCLQACWESSLTLTVSLPLITATCWKPFRDNVQKLSVSLHLCVWMCICECHLFYLKFFSRVVQACINAHLQLQGHQTFLVIFPHLNQSDFL